MLITFHCRPGCYHSRFVPARFEMLRTCSAALLVIIGMSNALPCGALDDASIAASFLAAKDSCRYVTNAVQFRTLTGAEYLDGCNFHLTGVATLVDRDRDLMVLQDATGAVALNFPLRDRGLRFGQLLSLTGTNCSPYLVRFSDYPFRPSVREVRETFEAPVGSGGYYYLARMRGYLRPPSSGDYSFFIASDNSSELWLSTDDSPSRAKKIAFLSRFQWVQPREWTRYQSQRSEPIWLQAGKTYYIEALHEQTTMGDNLAVAWQGPGLKRSVIDGRYVRPANSGLTATATNGILREVWKNFMAGDLTGIGGARAFHSALSVEMVDARLLGPGQLPKPDSIVIGRPWREENNYRWVATEGVVNFVGADEASVWLRLLEGTAQVQVRSPRLDDALLRRLQAARIRVRGVCEGVYNGRENLEPGIIWISGESDIDVLEEGRTNFQSAAVERTDIAWTASDNSARRAFYSTRGVVTFNGSVMGQQHLVVQDEESAVLLSGGETCSFQNRLKVGEWVELGGAVHPGKDLPVLAPLVIAELGMHCMPVPIAEPLCLPSSANRTGAWSELTGVAHSVASNGMLCLVNKGGRVYLWIADTSTNELVRLIDARIRAQGVFWPDMLDAPVLLVPSRNYVDVEEPAPQEPFDVPRRLISELFPDETKSSLVHRVKVFGEITYRDDHSCVLQDASGGIRVLLSNRLTPKIGETAEALGFPAASAGGRALTDALVRPVKSGQRVQPRRLEMSETLWTNQVSTLVVAEGTALAQKTNDNSHTLELQEQRRVFAATLSIDAGRMPDIAPGSRVRIIGVCEDDGPAPLSPGEKPSPKRSFGAFNILVRSPSDVRVLSGPPWWTLKRTVALVSTLMTVIAATSLWIHMLRRRLERQHAAQLAFSQRVLGKLEEERRRIAVNLHDSLGHALLAIQNCALVAAHSPVADHELRGHMGQISEVTSQAIEEVRHIAQGLRPSQLDRLGLTQAIRASVNRASENGSILFASRVDDIDGLFDKDDEIHVFRIIQEAVTNVVKHSNATEAAVVIKRLESSLSLSVRDNGCGFDSAKKPDSTHEIGYGLCGIRERVRILGGALTLDARVGIGTRLTIEVPFRI
jgi:signal transduction histidine kinase